MWLKYEESHAAGYYPAVYVEFDPLGAVEDLKAEIIAAAYDGVRTPRFEILENLPPEVLEQKIKYAEEQLCHWVNEYNHLTKQRVQPSGS